MRSLITMGMAMALAACTIDAPPDDGHDKGNGSDDGVAEAFVAGWSAAAWGTTADFTGLDTGWSSPSSTCVLTGVLGNLTRGDFFQVGDVQAEAAATVGPNGHWFVEGHGGAYTNDVNRSVAYGNPVMAGVVCVPYKATAFGSWRSQDPMFGTAPPKRFADLAPTRRCFLSKIFSGAGIFGQWADSAQVVRIDVGHTDGSHPTPGWYVQGTLQSNTYTGEPATVDATCIDFPSIDGEWGGAFGGATNPMTTGGGVKMCGLTGIFGAFNQNSYSDGVRLNAPSTQTGNWSMTVSANKFATANCVE